MPTFGHIHSCRSHCKCASSNRHQRWQTRQLQEEEGGRWKVDARMQTYHATTYSEINTTHVVRPETQGVGWWFISVVVRIARQCASTPTDLQLHDVTTGRGANEPGADFQGLFVHGTNVARVFVVVNHLYIGCVTINKSAREQKRTHRERRQISRAHSTHLHLLVGPPAGKTARALEEGNQRDAQCVTGAARRI